MRCERLLRAILCLQLLRHGVVLANQPRVVAFMRSDRILSSGAEEVGATMVLPVLDESHRLQEAVEYFEGLLRAGSDRIILVTSARENGGIRSATARAAAALADGRFVFHVHVDAPHALKGDQVNMAARKVVELAPDSTWDRQLIVVYDIDSRPPPDSLAAFARAALAEPRTPIFHQSARFEVRDDVSGLRRLMAEGAALRANRYVVAYELPRLMSRRAHTASPRRAAAAATFGHVTGHGLGVRLSWLLRHPLPTRTVMEDLAYSFELAVGGVPICPLHSLDRSEVPTSSRALHAQAERWFRGPGRALAYRGDPRRSVGRRDFVTLSAMLIVLEWLSCAFAAPLLAVAASHGQASTRRLARIFAAEVAAEAVVAEAFLGKRRTAALRVQALLAYPVASAAFGIAGWSSLIKGALRIPVDVKTR